MTTVVVVAKECVPGHVKTRLSPPLTPVQCARVARASLDDTLDVVRSVPARHVLYLAGSAPSSAAGFEVLPQCPGPLDVRLAHLLDRLEGPMVLIGMDTPQLDRAVLAALCRPWPADVDAVLGPAVDGGFWLLGMREPAGDVVRGVAMSVDTTGRDVHARLVASGRTVSVAPTLADVDTVDVALDVASLVPGSRFARALRVALRREDPAPPSRRSASARRAAAGSVAS